ncbi:hypothetical protein FNY66_07570 [Mediterraneibacter catenae]|jgi:hypothetical protein|uniref:DUF3592 domain-containing protein n=1 Tax=Mediterraneibacter catenae TaxID=2594882 RepID=A0A5M9HXI6_9FIRM|nr:hypothetical protein [Mediterraneibacter catenae]KAA8501458.1 hypothetical protein FNY66_07570 [Mediterraneibacter catenae]HIW41534.1 hypothetical protein [Candidatus Mediterraneibacter vanvlietii]
MGKSGRKIKNHEIILCILVLAVIAAGLLLPETGNLVLLDEFCDVAVIWIVCIYVIVRVLRNRTALPFSGRAAGVAAVIVCIAVALWFSKDIGLDLAAGPQTATLTDIQLSKAQAHTGIFSHHYYLTGSDNNGVTLRAEITGEEYSRLPQGGTVTIEYYEHTRRIVKVY